MEFASEREVFVSLAFNFVITLSVCMYVILLILCFVILLIL